MMSTHSDLTRARHLLAQWHVPESLEEAASIARTCFDAGEPDAATVYAQARDRLSIMLGQPQPFGTLRSEQSGEIRLDGGLSTEVSDEERATLGFEPAEQITRSVHEENLRRARKRFVEGLAADERFGRVWDEPAATDLLLARDRHGSSVWRDGEDLVFIWQGEADSVVVCCGLQMPLWRIDGADVWTLRVRIRGIERAIIGYTIQPSPRPEGQTTWAFHTWRGELAPPLPAQSQVRGEITSHTFESKHLAHPRSVKVYLPPGHDPSKRYPVCYAADGNAWVGQTAEAAALPPFIVVGIAPSPEPGGRTREYMPGIDPAAFERHERFIIEEVAPWAQSTFGASSDPQEAFVTGNSNGADVAIALASRNPKTLGAAVAFSVCVRPDALGEVSAESRYYVLAPTLDFVYDNCLRVADKLREHGAEVSVREVVGGHDGTVWSEMFPDAAAWALGMEARGA